MEERVNHSEQGDHHGGEHEQLRDGVNFRFPEVIQWEHINSVLSSIGFFRGSLAVSKIILHEYLEIAAYFARVLPCCQGSEDVTVTESS